MCEINSVPSTSSGFSGTGNTPKSAIHVRNYVPFKGQVLKYITNTVYQAAHTSSHQQPYA